MATWRCPHCGTHQADSSRCWVCSRSAMSCSSCRNFRPAVAARLGYCALDRTHEPLHGDEIRPCWQALTDVEPGPEPGIFQLVRPRSGLGPGALRSVDPVPPADAAEPLQPVAEVTARRPPAPPMEQLAWITVDGVAAVDAVALPATMPAPETRPLSLAHEVPGAAAVAPDRPSGRLIEAPLVAPALRLGTSGSADGERGRLLERGPVR